GLVFGQAEPAAPSGSPAAQQPGGPADIAGAAGAAGATATAEAAAKSSREDATTTLPPGVSPYDYLGYGGRWSVDYQFLYWWNKNGRDLPPLVGGGEGGLAGTGKVALAGGVGASLDFQGNPGGRLTLAYWCDDCRTYGWDTSFLFVPK